MSTNSKNSPPKVTCPTCGTAVPWIPDSHWRPFCSERCKLIDLGEWLDEGHRISEPLGVDLPDGIPGADHEH